VSRPLILKVDGTGIFANSPLTWKLPGGNSSYGTAEGSELLGTPMLQCAPSQQQRIPYDTPLNPKDRSFDGPAGILTVRISSDRNRC